MTRGKAKIAASKVRHFIGLQGEFMTTQLLRHVFCGLLACSLLTVPAMAQGNGHGNGKAKGHDKNAKDDDGDRGEGKYYFQTHDRELVTTYYSKHGKGLPPGLAKRNGSLPPGLEKQLQRNGSLPPGLDKKMEPCPLEITRQLPPLPPDYRRGVVGASIVVFNVRTNIVVDVMHDVVR
jgi:hypothetical protein